MKRFFCITALSLAIICMGSSDAFAQKASKSSAKSKQSAPAVQAPPQRPNPVVGITEVIDRIYNYLNGCTPAAIIDKDGKEITDLGKIDENSSFKKGDFGINTYEWGVTYSGMLLASEVLGDSKYAQYAYDRLNVVGSAYQPAKEYYNKTGYQMRFTPLVNPKWLDDCGAMTAAMIKATIADPQQSKGFRALMDNWFNFCYYKEYRMGDGILARHRPATNSVWLDDMYMGITPIAFRGKLSQIERGDLTQQYYNEAINQVLLFKKYLWVPEKSFYRHGWIEGMAEHPNYHWARANGWAVLTICDVLDAVPQRTQGWNECLELLKDLLRGLAPYQSPEGTWHQLIDKTESYLETSASAMYVYGYAHAINMGWIDRTAYQDIAKSGWNGVAKQVNSLGQVENTCVGTGLGWTNTFYEGRPVSVFAAHGYGPVLLAAAEMIKLYQTPMKPQFNYYAAVTATPRKDDKPVLFLAGDSTCNSGNGANGVWGWGSFFQEYMSDSINVENNAVAGLSSRTFFNNGNWNRLRVNIKEGDYVIIQFGHNDQSPINSGRARGTYPGCDDKVNVVVMEKNGGPEEVYSYGHYVRMMVRQARLRGATPIIVSPTPQNRWEGDNKIERMTDTYTAWCKQIAAEEGCEFIDLNDIAASKYEQMGKTKAQADYFADVVHTREAGARMYCKTLSEALKSTSLGKFVK